ncbi:PREDICTED: aldose 1-epimerase-like [Atta cephalotes]|uniref:Aldose 1-epimerase n=1 Tax=Atta cephalotes TaxID=12957 RepID=A0A158NKI4_ATTCE|nr:PREDICTED: aldose 1-epimerase-like [Atta cephalotes]
MSRFFVFLVFSSWLGTSMATIAQESITTTTWGSVNDQEIKKFTLRNNANQEVDVVTYGAVITAIRTPDREGNIADVVLGFDNIEGYLSSENPYFGATIGRVANRIGKATFVVDGQRYNVSKNSGENSLHGGTHGWSSKVWNATIQDDCVVMTLVSPDDDEGYPGSVTAIVSFQLTNDGELRIEMKAHSEKATPINLTNHSYFNLAGHATNASELYKHMITINADCWTVTDSESIPTGEIQSVVNTIMDLRNLKKFGDVIDKVPGGGYDNNFCLPKSYNDGKVNFVAKVVHPSSGRSLKVYSNQPGVQLYTTNSVPENGIVGKNGAKYFKHAAFCLETQNYPDAINHENFPNSVLQPGDTYNHVVLYKFGVKN